MQVRMTIFNSEDIGSIDICDDIGYKSRSNLEDNDKSENSEKLYDDEIFREMTWTNKDFIYHREYRCKVENCQRCNGDLDKELIQIQRSDIQHRDNLEYRNLTYK